ncbi:hypothetical protein QU600_000585 [Orientia tsutsugamushi]
MIRNADKKSLSVISNDAKSFDYSHLQ